jgi:hypothetical protein
VAPKVIGIEAKALELLSVLLRCYNISQNFVESAYWFKPSNKGQLPLRILGWQARYLTNAVKVQNTGFSGKAYT